VVAEIVGVLSPTPVEAMTLTGLGNKMGEVLGVAL